MKLSALCVPLIAAAYVSAHGFLASVTIAGKSFKGNVPNGRTDPSIIRQVSDVSPIKGANNPAVNCGKDAKPASLSGDANPGDELTFDWRGGDNSFWPHNTGPMLTYMASCGDTTCDKFDSAQAEWFKIAEVGLKSNGQWAQADLMKGGVDTARIPSDLAPGNYLVRHEIIALHLANSRGGAEFYPACFQVKVGGNSNGRPSSNDEVALPGGYSDNDPGIFVPNIFNGNLKYDFPGPQIARFIDGGASNSGSSGSDSGSGSGSGSGSSSGSNSGSASSSSNAPRPSSSSSSSSANNGNEEGNNNSSGPTASKCKLKKSTTAVRASATANAKRSHHPRTISRIMRDLTLGHNSH